MTARRAIVVSDAHLGQAPRAVADAFHRFLAGVPKRAEHLVINGDLFDFWFEYRTVIPRDAFPTLAALDRVRAAGVRLTVLGGNHDRFGRGFWGEALGAAYHPREAVFDLAGYRALVAHGDGLNERLASRALQAVVHLPAVQTMFRWVHPDLGLRLVRRLSGRLADTTRRRTLLEGSSAAQAAWARRVLARRVDLDLVVLGHSHLPVLDAVGPRRWYVNPGAWMEGLRYLEVTEEGPRLCQYDPSRG